MNMTAQRIRRWAAGTFLIALLVVGFVLMSTVTLFVVAGQLLAIFLALIAVLLMVVSLFFPHEIE